MRIIFFHRGREQAFLLGSRTTTCLKIGYDLSISVSLTVLGCLLATSESWFTNLPEPTRWPTVLSVKLAYAQLIQEWQFRSLYTHNVRHQGYVTNFEQYTVQ